MTLIKRFSIIAVPPFDFELSAQIFANGDPQVRRYEKGRFWQVIRIDDTLALVSIQSAGTVEDPELSIELKSNRQLTIEDKNEAKKIVKSLFNLDFNLNAFYEEARND